MNKKFYCDQCGMPYHIDDGVSKHCDESDPEDPAGVNAGADGDHTPYGTEEVV